MRKWLVLKDGYVIDAFIWDGINEFNYPNTHDFIIEDIEEIVNIGDWYEQSENIFYRPTKKPNDIPKEIEGIWND